MKVLILIPARGGSKGIPGKNIKPLAGRPLIYYTLDIAKRFLEINKIEAEICVSTDDYEIQRSVNDYGIDTPFIRPDYLSTDESTTTDVILHAINFYKEIEIEFNYVILLQPTSPFRRLIDLNNSWEIVQNDSDLNAVISVFDSGANPYYNLVEEKNGFIEKTIIISNITRRQDTPKVYQLNGAIYIFKVDEFLKVNSIINLEKIKKIEMPLINSIDIDYQSDWDYCEYLLNSNIIKSNTLLFF